MTDNETIKALECCMNEFCPSTCPMLGVHHCGFELRKNALDLINRQKATIRDADIRIEYLAGKVGALSLYIDKKEQEIERWKSSAELWEGDAKDLFISREQIKADAVKEFAERLKWFLSEECGNVVEDNPNLDEIIFGYRKEEVDEYIENL